LRKLLEIDPEGYTANRVTAMFGRSLQYSYATLKVAQKLRPELFEQWRASKTKPLPLLEMASIASHPVDLQVAAYAKAVVTTEEERHARKALKPWFVAAIRRAEAQGRYLGILQREGVLQIRPDVDWVSKIRFLVRFKKSLGGTDIPVAAQERIAQTMADAFLQASHEERTEEEEEREEDWNED